MAAYWIGDAYGRVLGPLDLELVQDLISAGRLQGITRVSTDGASWADVASIPEIAALQAAQTGEARRERDLQEAARLGVELERLRERAPHEVFALAADAPVERWRAGFFALVKQFYPERLDPSASPELRRVNAEIFAYLSELMAFIERHPPVPASPQVPASAPAREGRNTGAIAAAATPAPSTAIPPRDARTSGAFGSVTPPPTRRTGPNPAVAAAPGAAAPPRESPRRSGPHSVIVLPASDVGLHAPAAAGSPAAPAAPPSYALTEFIGFERRDDNVMQANVHVTAKNCGIFTDDRLFNLTSNGVFIPCPEVQALGSRVEMRFYFRDPPREVSSRGIVVSWNAGDGKQPRGFGIQFTRLDKADMAFLKDFVARASEKHS